MPLKNQGAAGKMSIERAFEVLELSPSASMVDIDQAYRDMAAVWHPDRFEGSPRLRAKAEHRLKEINAARDLLASRARARARPIKAPEKEIPPMAEVIAEAGTRLVMKAWWNISRAVKKMAASSDDK